MLGLKAFKDQKEETKHEPIDKNVVALSATVAQTALEEQKHE